jgi:hypothetical protein
MCGGPSQHFHRASILLDRAKLQDDVRLPVTVRAHANGMDPRGERKI